MSIAFVPRDMLLVDQTDRMSSAWYRFFQELYQFSGLAGAQFPLLEMSAAAAHIVPSGAAPATFAAYGAGIFDATQFVAAADTTGNARFQVPYGALESAPIIPRVLWLPETADPGYVRWQLSYVIAVADEVMAAPTVLLTDATSPAVSSQWVLTEFDVISAPQGSTVVMEIARLGTADTYPAAAWAFTAGLRYDRAAHGQSRRV